MNVYSSLDTSQPQPEIKHKRSGREQFAKSNSNFEVDHDLIKRITKVPGSGILRNNVYFPRSIDDLKKLRK